MIERVCEHCSKHFLVYPSQLSGKHGKKAIFCSHDCQAKSRVGTHQSEETNRKKSGALSHKVEVTCQQCDGQFLTKPSIIKRGSGKFCSMRCYAQFKRSQENWNWWRKGKGLPEEVKRKISLARMGTHASDETKRKMSLARKGEIPYNAIKAVTAKWQDKEWASKQIRRMMAGIHIRPNKAELRLQAILDKYCPNEWQYTGDGYLIIGGFAPDFANRNGKKELIELFGDYWHSPQANPAWHQTELGRVMVYNSLGYRCLVIWERELNSLPEDEIVNKIKAFIGVKK